MKKIIYHVLGWYGMCAILFAYAAVSWQWMTPHQFTYLFLNCSGSGILSVVSFRSKAWPVFGLNFTWTLISLTQLVMWAIRIASS